jgi:hypothetical protein
MWRMWRVIDPRKAIVLTGLMIAFISTSIHLIQISQGRSGESTATTKRGFAAKVRTSGLYADRRNSLNPFERCVCPFIF